MQWVAVHYPFFAWVGVFGWCLALRADLLGLCSRPLVPWYLVPWYLGPFVVPGAWWSPGTLVPW